MWNLSWVLLSRNGVYFALALTMIVASPLLAIDGPSFSAVLGVFSIMAFTHTILAWSREGTEFSFPLFLADCFVAWIVVRATGGSGSPFVVLFPLIVLAGSIVFELKRSILLTMISVVAMTFSVGFSVSIFGNALAIAIIGVLGLYLKRNLSITGMQLRDSEMARRRLENLQAAILANIPSGLMSVDSQGHIIQINRVGCSILSVEESRLLGQSLRDVIPDLDREIRKLNTMVPETGLELKSEDRPTVEYLHNDHKRHLGYSASRLSDPETGDVLGTLVVFQDLTRVLELEETLRRSEKLAAVGKLSASIAHEIRNPLASISGSAQLLGQDLSLSDDDKHLLQIIQKESRRLDDLINEFLEFVRPTKLKLGSVDLHAVVEGQVEAIQVSEKWKSLGAELGLQVSSQNVKVLGDADKISQVVANLLLNSAQAGATRVEVILARKDRGVWLEIFDNGSGISAENQKNLFEPFFTTKEKGTGLGLAISHKLLESMRAKVFVQSPVPEFCEKGGTVFKIEFQEAST